MLPLLGLVNALGRPDYTVEVPGACVSSGATDGRQTHAGSSRALAVSPCGLDYPYRYNSMRTPGAAMASRRAYISLTVRDPTSEKAMAFKANYGRDRAERARAARARSEEKQRKRDEKTALRKAQRAEAESPPDETNPSPEEKQS